MRVYMLGKQGGRELKRLVHPRSALPLKLGNRTLDPEVANAVWGYVALYILCVVVLTLIVAGLEDDLVTAVSVVFSSINNLGPALGEAGANYGRSEEHTSELQSRGHHVCRLLLVKKK